MQPLSPRAVQAHTYTCASCAARLNVPITRTAISTNRSREPKFGETSAAFSTTILASTTAHDGRLRSGQRDGNKKWLRVKPKITAHLRQVYSLVAQDKYGRKAADFVYEPIAALTSIARKMGDPLVRHEESNHAYKIFLQDLYRLRGLSGKLGRQAPNYSMAALERALKEERMHFAEDREPMTDDQFQKFHDMINWLVNDLVKQAYFDEVPGDPDLARRNIESLDSAWTAIRLLRSEGYPRYRNPHGDPVAASEARHKLSDTIDSLFEMNRYERKRIKPKFLVAKICYNLLVCEYPPTIHHYNALILGFSLQGMPNLVDLVASSLLHNSRFRSTPQTVVCLLAHYKNTRDIQGFFSIVQRLVGADVRGLLQTRRLLRQNMFLPAYVRSWVKKNEAVFAFGGRLAIKLPVRNLDVYEALIAGLLVFGRTKDAVKVLLASIQEGVAISLDLFIDVLRHSLYRLNTPTTRILAHGLFDHVDAAVQPLLGVKRPRRMAIHFYALFSVLQQMPEELSRERATIIHSSRWLFIPHNHDGPARLLTIAMFIRNAERRLDQLGHILRFANKMTSATTMAQKYSIASSTVRRLQLHMRQDEVRAQQVAERRKLFRLVGMLEKATWGLNAKNVFYIHEKVVRILGGRLHFPGSWGILERRQHRDNLELLADHWVRYRARKKEELLGVAGRLQIEIRLSLCYCERLVRQYEEWAAQHPQLMKAWKPKQVDEDEVVVKTNWLRPWSGLLMD